MSQTSHAIQLVLSALRAEADAANVASSLANVDNEAVAVAAIVLGLAPLLHWRLDQLGITLSTRAMTKLVAAREMARAQQRALGAQLDRVLDALNSRNLVPVLLKGAHLANFVYPESALRQMSDIDLLVEPDEMPRVAEAFRALGYNAEYKSPELGARVKKHTVTFRPPRADDATPNPYLSAAEGRTVEPHTSLEESWYGLRADVTKGVHARSQVVEHNGRRARVLCADDLILHLSTHLAFHLIMGYPSLVQFVDLNVVTRRMEKQICWEKVVARAQENRVAPFVYAALRAAEEILAAPIPRDALTPLAQMCPPRIRARAEQINLENILARTQRAPVTTFAQRVEQGWRARAEAARWAPTLGEQWRVWQTLLDVTRTDTGQMISQRLRNAFARA